MIVATVSKQTHNWQHCLDFCSGRHLIWVLWWCNFDRLCEHK